MKKIISYIFLSLPFVVMAQVSIDRTKAPKPGPAPVIKIKSPASFVLPNGLKVFVVTNNKLPRVSATLTIDRESLVEGEKAGVTNIAGQLMRRGTTKMSKAVLDEEIDFLGASIGASATTVSGTALKNNFSKVMSLMADIALRPSFPTDELEKIRKQTLSGLAQAKEDPNSIAQTVVSKLVYGKNHPYGEVETEKTVAAITINDVKKYYNTYWKPNIAYLIFVGDITVEEAKKLATAHFATWKKGIVPKPIYEAPKPANKTYIAVVDKPSSVQSVINIVNTVSLKPGAADDIPATVMSNLLGGGSTARLYKNLREQYGFTYGAYSSVSSDKLVGNFSANASVRNEKTDSAIGQFLFEFNRLRNEAIDEEEVSRNKNEMSGAFARRLENPATIANFALNVARYNLPQDYYQNYLKNLSAVDAKKVQEVAKKFVQVNNLHIVIVGNAKEIAKGLEKYGTVKYYDVDGNEVSAPVTKTVDASITGKSILEKAAAASASKAVMAEFKDLLAKGTANVMGQNLNYTQTYIAPNNFRTELTIQGMSIMKQMSKAGEYSQVMQGQSLPLEDKDKEEMTENGYFFTEAYLIAQPNYSFTVKGIEKVNEKDAYAVEIKSPLGRTFTAFYSVETGLRVKDTKVEEGPQGKATTSVYYQEYKTYYGIQVPVKMLIDQGQLKINVAITDVQINAGLKLEDLK